MCQFLVTRLLVVNVMGVLTQKLRNSPKIQELVGGFSPTHFEKYAISSNWELFPQKKIGVKIPKKKSLSCHQLDKPSGKRTWLAMENGSNLKLGGFSICTISFPGGWL